MLTPEEALAATQSALEAKLAELDKKLQRDCDKRARVEAALAETRRVRENVRNNVPTDWMSRW